MTTDAGHVLFTLRLPDRTGAARMALHFAAAFRRAGHAVTVVHGPPPTDGPSILADLREAGAHTALDRRLARPWSPLLVRDLVERAKREEARAIIGVNQRDRLPAVLAAARAGVPGIVMVQNQHHFWGNGVLSRAKRFAYRLSVGRFTTLAVCTSEVVRSQIVAFGLPEARTVVLPNGIDPDVGPPPADPDDRRRLRDALGLDAARLVFVSVGRLDPQKGHDVLIDAFGSAAELRDQAQVVIVGAGGTGDQLRARWPEELRSKTRAMGLEDTIRFTGWRDDVAQILAIADGYVHTARWEGPALPLAVMEAMATGLPTVFTDCSGSPPHFEQGRDGLMVRSGDPHDLARALTRLVAMDADARRVMGANAAALIRDHYAIDDLAARFVDLVRGTWR
ncbi:MAG: glycosyltransferase family 4 protein [Acidimicrobiales bacterium]